MVWLHQHALRRGLFQDLDLPGDSDDDVAAALLTPKTGAALAEPVLDEGGQSDLEGKAASRMNPLHRRYLKVSDASAVDEAEASYQSLLVISDVPDGGMVFPGSEVIGRIDESGLDVDWAMRLSIRSSASSRRAEPAGAAQPQRAVRPARGRAQPRAEHARPGRSTTWPSTSPSWRATSSRSRPRPP